MHRPAEREGAADRYQDERNPGDDVSARRRDRDRHHGRDNRERPHERPARPPQPQQHGGRPGGRERDAERLSGVEQGGVELDISRVIAITAMDSSYRLGCANKCTARP